MAKFNTGLVKGYRELQDKQKNEQQREKVKKAINKFAFSPISNVIRKIATILLLLLATVGLLALLHPETRTALINILNMYFVQIKNLLNL